MSDYEVVWTVTVRKMMPLGMALAGEHPISGSGKTPQLALKAAQDWANDRESESNQVQELLGKEWAAT